MGIRIRIKSIDPEIYIKKKTVCERGEKLRLTGNQIMANNQGLNVEIKIYNQD